MRGCTTAADHRRHVGTFACRRRQLANDADQIPRGSCDRADSWACALSLDLDGLAISDLCQIAQYDLLVSGELRPTPEDQFL